MYDIKYRFTTILHQFTILVNAGPVSVTIQQHADRIEEEEENYGSVTYLTEF